MGWMSGRSPAEGAMGDRGRDLDLGRGQRRRWTTLTTRGAEGQSFHSPGNSKRERKPLMNDRMETDARAVRIIS